MTLHIHYDHKCPKCETPYVPYDAEVACPKCGLLEADRYDFVSEAANSALFNLNEFGQYTPMMWMVLSFGDELLSQAFYMLELHRIASELPFNDLGQIYYDKFAPPDFPGSDYMRQYFARLCERISEKTDELLANG